MELLSSFPQYASDLLTISVKLAYPFWASFKAITSPDGNDDTTWLIYWVVLAITSFAECYLVPFVQWVPFFMLARLIFYIWLQLPVCNGSIFLFTKFIKPFLSKNSALLEKITIEDSKDATGTFTEICTKLNSVYTEIKQSLE